MWRRPEDTKLIFNVLLVGFLVTSFFSMDTVVQLMGYFLGFKLFIQDAIYHHYPRLKAKYDTTAQLWDRLPTNAQLEKSKAITAHNQSRLSSNSKKLVRTDSLMLAEEEYKKDIEDEDKTFCDNFNLPYEEHPIKDADFKNGRNCFQYEKGARLSIGVSSALNNHAKLYLTPSFLCYEKRNDERFTIALSNITRLEKRKPLHFLPGAGMALELSVAGFEKPIIFAGLLQRDEWYNRLMQQGREHALSYSTAEDVMPSDSIRLSDLGAAADNDDKGFDISVISGGERNIDGLSI